MGKLPGQVCHLRVYLARDFASDDGLMTDVAVHMTFRWPGATWRSELPVGNPPS